MEINMYKIDKESGVFDIRCYYLLGLLGLFIFICCWERIYIFEINRYKYGIV